MEGSYTACEHGRRFGAKISDDRHRRLRTGRKRPRCRGATEQRDKLASSHAGHRLSPLWRLPARLVYRVQPAAEVNWFTRLVRDIAIDIGMRAEAPMYEVGARPHLLRYLTRISSRIACMLLRWPGLSVLSAAPRAATRPPHRRAA